MDGKIKQAGSLEDLKITFVFFSPNRITSSKILSPLLIF